MEHLSFSDLSNLVKKLSINSTKSTVKYDYGSIDSKLTLLSNQFFYIVNFPQFNIDFISSSAQHILGINPDTFTLKHFFALIHPHDLPTVLLASKKLIEFLLLNLKSLKTKQIIASFDFRLKTSKGNFIRVLNQNELISKVDNNSSCSTIATYTDITQFKSSEKIEFEFINYGSAIDFVFPDEELRNIGLLFTSREREILSLLAHGNNSDEIGEKLCISKHTVDTHRRHMLSKSHLCNTPELVAFAFNNHLF